MADQKPLSAYRYKYRGVRGIDYTNANIKNSKCKDELPHRWVSAITNVFGYGVICQRCRKCYWWDT